ncbi:vacuolar sorting protein VPS33/slp1 [Thoreauomyces humboldtii]|nr:vacuolar sorting protein VPS33/slp1 [Thoreauomyces humboldtii]
MTVIDVIRKKILDDMVKAVDPPGRWKVMVVDIEALRILNTVVKLADLTDEHVICVEGLAKRRQAYPDREVIYFISPDPSSIQHIMDDFSQPNPPYAQIHIFCTAPLPDTLFDKIKRSPASSFIRSLKELNVDFSAPESHVFTVDLHSSLKTTFNPQSPSFQNYELEKIGKRLATVLASLGEYPYIRYHDPTNGAKPSVNGKLANIVQTELDNLSRLDKDFPPATQYQRGILLIVDRSADILTPLLHHFTYQSMVMDVLGLVDMKYLPEDATDPVKLDESDVVWNQARHWHIAEVMEFLAAEVNKFTTENKAAAFALNSGGSSGLVGSFPLCDVTMTSADCLVRSGANAIQALKDTMAHLPQYQEMKAKYSIHTSMCAEAMKEYNQTRLERVGQVEQDLAVGETSDGKSPKLSLTEILGLLDDARIIHEDKLRLVMLFLVVQNGLSDGDRQKLLDSARLTLEESQAVHNLSMLGVRLSASLMGRGREGRGQYAYGMRDRGKPVKFENTRFTPILKYMMEDTVKNLADATVFPWIREPPPSELGGRPMTWAASGSPATGSPSTPTASIRSKANWANRRGVVSAVAGGAGPQTGLNAVAPAANLRANGPRLITFVLGGVTPSEMKACYDVMKDQQREVIIGSTHILTPSVFVDDLKDLHRHGPQRPQRPSQPQSRPSERSVQRDRQEAQQQQQQQQQRGGGGGDGYGDRQRDRHGSAGPSDRYGRSASGSGSGSYRDQQPQQVPAARPSLAARLAQPRPGAFRADSAPNINGDGGRGTGGGGGGGSSGVASRVGNIEARMANLSVRDGKVAEGAGRYGGAAASGRDARDGRDGREGRESGSSRREAAAAAAAAAATAAAEEKKKKGWFHRK